MSVCVWEQKLSWHDNKHTHTHTLMQDSLLRTVVRDNVLTQHEAKKDTNQVSHQSDSIINVYQMEL